ncbi:MAG: peptide-methionine (S)-S-oxide reductase MsrA [Fimbriimonadaceae bacterium]|nr:peptide-methionine (S)-S-oxide reductase MsrA [Fimbriimonadaceae bacterium]
MGNNALKKATFGAGCFWGVEHIFRTVPGVVDTVVGYEGGSMDQPTYRDVCTDTTGHAEVVEVTYDPAVVAYDELLRVFWELHDPTQLNRQGPDYGSQYRSAVFYHDEEQKAAAEASKAWAQEFFTKPIATRIEPATTFWVAEDYHQQYLEKTGRASCHMRRPLVRPSHG